MTLWTVMRSENSSLWLLIHSRDGLSVTMGSFREERIVRRICHLLNREGMIDAPLLDPPPPPNPELYNQETENE